MVSEHACSALIVCNLWVRVIAEFLDPIDKKFQKKMQTSGFSQVWFSDSKIKQCTDNFSHKIGQGGFGDVFYGKLSDGQEIAAKVLSPESCQSKQEFYNEVRSLFTFKISLASF